MKERGFHVSYRAKKILIAVASLAFLIFFYIFKDASYLVRAASAIGFIILFYLTDSLFDIRFTKKHYIFILIIAVSSFLLSPLYFLYPNYDKIQHLIQPIMFASIVFFMTNKLDLKFRWKVLFTVFVVIGSLALFEIGEYYLDYLFDLKLQGVFLRDIEGIEKYKILLDRNDDTMLDLSLGVIGTGIFAFYAWILMKRKINY